MIPERPLDAAVRAMRTQFIAGEMHGMDSAARAALYAVTAPDMRAEAERRVVKALTADPAHRENPAAPEWGIARVAVSAVMDWIAS